MGFEGQGDEFAPLMEHVVRDIMGEPNKALSRNGELRYGTKGAISIDLTKGVYHDWHDDSGGGVLKFVETYGMMDRPQALNYLRGFGLAKQEDRATQAADKPSRAIAAKYDYVDEHGELLFQVVRFTDGAPRFLQRRPDPENVADWIWNTKDVRKIPYRLPDIQDAIARGVPVWVVEGEKDVDNLFKLQIPATCNPGGAGKWPDACTEALRGAKLVLCGDNDDAGRKHVELIASKMASVAASIVTVALPGLPEKGDITDWIAARPDDPAGALLREYDRQIRERGDAPTTNHKYKRIAFSDLDAVARPMDYVIKNIIPANAFGLIYGDSQAGKSFVAIDIALHVAMGREWYGHRVRKGGVIYQAGEGEYGIVNRFKAARNALGAPRHLPIEIIPQPVDLWSPGGDTDALIKEFLDIAKTLSEPLSLIVIDTHATASAGADENSAKDMTLLIQHYKQIALATGATVLVVHHRNADGSKMRGHTSLPAAADFTMEITVEGKAGDKNRIRTWQTIKQKDGENGVSGNFLLRRVVLEIDSDKDEVSSCFIEPVERQASQTAQQAAPTLKTEALACLRDLLAISRWDVPDDISDEWVEAVCRNDEWRDEFCKRHHRGDNIRNTQAYFYRAKKALLADKVVGQSGKFGDDFCWLTSDGRRKAYSDG